MTVAGKILRGIAGLGLTIFGGATANPALVAAGVGVGGSLFDRGVTTDYKTAADKYQADAAAYAAAANEYNRVKQAELGRAAAGSAAGAIVLPPWMTYVGIGILLLIVGKLLGLFRN